MNTISIDPNKSLSQIRFQELAQKILDNFEDSDLRKYSTIEPYTIKRWAKGSHSPQPRSISEIAKIIAVSDQTLTTYLDGTISIDQIWEKRGESLRFSAKHSTDYDSIVYSIKNMSLDLQLAVLQEIASSIRLGLPQIQQKDIKNITIECPVMIELSDKQKARLQILFAESKRYGQKTDKDLVEEGVYPPLIEDLGADFTRQYDQSAYQSLAPHLFEVLQWVEDLPILAYPSRIQSVDQLLSEIE